MSAINGKTLRLSAVRDPGYGRGLFCSFHLQLRSSVWCCIPLPGPPCTRDRERDGQTMQSLSENRILTTSPGPGWTTRARAPVPTPVPVLLYQCQCDFPSFSFAAFLFPDSLTSTQHQQSGTPTPNLIEIWSPSSFGKPVPTPRSIIQPILFWNERVPALSPTRPRHAHHPSLPVSTSLLSLLQTRHIPSQVQPNHSPAAPPSRAALPLLL